MSCRTPIQVLTPSGVLTSGTFTIKVYGGSAELPRNVTSMHVNTALDELWQARQMRIESSIQPCVRYARAGSPYGHNQRGKKKWLLEQKRKSR